MAWRISISRERVAQDMVKRMSHQHPNVLFLDSDQHRADVTGYA